jgi:hypothetical protein
VIEIVLLTLAGAVSAGLFSALCFCVAGSGMTLIARSGPLSLCVGLCAGAIGAVWLARADGRAPRDPFGLGCIAVAVLDLLGVAALAATALWRWLEP